MAIAGWPAAKRTRLPIDVFVLHEQRHKDRPRHRHLELKAELLRCLGSLAPKLGLALIIEAPLVGHTVRSKRHAVGGPLEPSQLEQDIEHCCLSSSRFVIA